eukprot:1065982-Rhodomonas_salina.4
MIYFSPIFESETHGYDTVDYFQIDRRVGDLQAPSPLSVPAFARRCAVLTRFVLARRTVIQEGAGAPAQARDQGHPRRSLQPHWTQVLRLQVRYPPPSLAHSPRCCLSRTVSCGFPFFHTRRA